MNEKQQTAVQWLVRKICADFIGKMPMHRWDEFIVIEHQALAMEREQIVNAHLTGLIYPLETSAGKQAEQYFTDTYQTEP